MSGYHPSHRPGSTPVFSSFAVPALGLGRTFAQAQAHAARLEKLRAVHGETYMRRVERMYHESPWGLEESERMAQPLAAFEWMATALSGGPSQADR